MRVFKAVTCPVCGCLCDDIELVVENKRIVGVKNGCSLCAAKFLGYNSQRLLKPLLRKNGKLVEATLDEAIRKAAGILSAANYPILYGWSSTSCEATRRGIELAEELGGIIDHTSAFFHGPSIMAIQDAGISTCTLGQIRHRADLIIYWGTNPLSSHPRHAERYTAFSEGRFRKSKLKAGSPKIRDATLKEKIYGTHRIASTAVPAAPSLADEAKSPAIPKQRRKVIVVDVKKTQSAEIADCFIQVEPNKDYELLQALRSLIKDEEISVDKAAGVPVEYLEEVADVMVNCNFGVFFFGLGLTMSKGRARNVEAALCLTRDLNTRTKFVIMPMRRLFNSIGVEEVFAWQTGYPYAVDFSLGHPRYNPGETSAIDVLLRKESDAALIVAFDLIANFPREAIEHLSNNPLIVIDQHLNSISQVADVVLPCAFAGVEAKGTAYHMDHVPLPLRRIVPPPKGCLVDEEILKRILDEVRRMKGKKTIHS